MINRLDKPPVAIIRTERSWNGPHRVVFKGHDKFYARNTTGKYPMDVSELRSAFTFGSSVAERVRQFRSERFTSLRNDKTPVLLRDHQGRACRGKIVVHCVPLDSFAPSRRQFDIIRLQGGPLPLINGRSGGTNQINLNGIITHSGIGTKEYTQLYRDGSIEAVEGAWLNITSEDKRCYPHLAIEWGIFRFLDGALKLQKFLGVDPPIMVAITLVSTEELRLFQDYPFSIPVGNPIMESDLILPETVIDNYEESVGKILKPMFDLVWNACGQLKSPHLDDNGNWIGRTP